MHPTQALVMMNPLIFTDLDGSLLDHYTYDWQPAAPLLKQLQKQGVPVIATTSKTQSEVASLIEFAPLSRIHIVENGAGIFLPKGEFTNAEITAFDQHFDLKTQCQDKEHWQIIAQKACKHFPDIAQALSHMSIETLIDITGLNPSQAIQASQRLFSELVFFQGNEKEKQLFIEQLENQGAHVLIGGRFIHVSGDCNKGSALQWVKACYERHFNERYLSIAIGDGENDIEMLETADIALIIPSPSHKPPKLNRRDNVYIANEYGPNGWQQGLEQIVNEIGLFKE